MMATAHKVQTSTLRFEWPTWSLPTVPPRLCYAILAWMIGLSLLIQAWPRLPAFSLLSYAPNIDYISLQGPPELLQNESTKHQIIKIIHDEMAKAPQGNFFTLDVAALQKQLEVVPWITTASVRRVWPHRLEVVIAPRPVVARFGDQAFIDKEGQLHRYQGATPAHLANLPRLLGPVAESDMLFKTYQQLQGLFDAHKLRISELALSNRLAWTITFDQGLVLQLGRTPSDDIFNERLQRFLKYYPMLQQQGTSVKYIDLRYDVGFATYSLPD